jgi:hypothetical protein
LRQTGSRFAAKRSREGFMRPIFIAASILAFSLAAFAASEDDIMATRYGNTTVIKDMLGTSYVHYNKDHTFNATSWLGDVSGSWKIENGKMCLYAEKYPITYKLKYSIPECNTIEAHKVGDKWKEGNRDFELAAGIKNN